MCVCCDGDRNSVLLKTKTKKKTMNDDDSVIIKIIVKFFDMKRREVNGLKADHNLTTRKRANGGLAGGANSGGLEHRYCEECAQSKARAFKMWCKVVGGQ